MTSALNIVTEDKNLETGVEKADEIAKGLRGVLADTYAIMFKTQGYHWNVEGPLFFSLHKLTEEQYDEMFEAADVVAERIRAIGRKAPTELASLLKVSHVTAADEDASAGDVCAELAHDHEKISKRLHELVELAERHNDPVTADLATARSAFHEQAVWMLKAIASE